MKATFDFEGEDAKPTRTLSAKEEVSKDHWIKPATDIFLKAAEKTQT